MRLLRYSSFQLIQKGEEGLPAPDAPPYFSLHAARLQSVLAAVGHFVPHHVALINAEGRVGSTHIIEHLVKLLGVHDEVGVTNHVVDSIRLGGGLQRQKVSIQLWNVPSIWGV